MSGAKHLGDILKDGFSNLGAIYGTKRISGTSVNTVSCYGFRASVDTVIAELANDTVDVGIFSGYKGATIKAGTSVYFPLPVTEITLTSGSGDVYLSIPSDTPTNPTISSKETNAAGTTITVVFSEDMEDPSTLKASFVVKVAGEAVELTSTELDTDHANIIITPTTPIANGDVVTLTIASKAIAAAAGGFFLGVTNGAITNNVPES